MHEFPFSHYSDSVEFHLTLREVRRKYIASLHTTSFGKSITKLHLSLHWKCISFSESPLWYTFPNRNFAYCEMRNKPYKLRRLVSVLRGLQDWRLRLYLITLQAKKLKIDSKTKIFILKIPRKWQSSKCSFKTTWRMWGVSLSWRWRIFLNIACALERYLEK